MQGRFSSFFWKIVVASSLLSPLVLFSSSLKPATDNNILGWISNFVIYPMQLSWHNGLFFVENKWSTYIALTDAAKENQKLRLDDEKIKARLLEYKELESEVSRLRTLLGFSQRLEKKHLLAEVISQPKKGPFETLRVNKGSHAGVSTSMPVISSVGVIGRVIKTGPTYADIQLLTDSNYYLDVILQRTRERGVLRGDFGSRCTLKLIRSAEIKIGDTIVTSGLVGGIPKGIPVGRVVKISYELDNITQIVSVQPWINPYQIEEVTILKSIDDEVQKIVNTAGESWLSKSIESFGGSF